VLFLNDTKECKRKESNGNVIRVKKSKGGLGGEKNRQAPAMGRIFEGRKKEKRNNWFSGGGEGWDEGVVGGGKSKKREPSHTKKGQRGEVD